MASSRSGSDSDEMEDNFNKLMANRLLKKSYDRIANPSNVHKAGRQKNSRLKGSFSSVKDEEKYLFSPYKFTEGEERIEDIDGSQLPTPKKTKMEQPVEKEPQQGPSRSVGAHSRSNSRENNIQKLVELRNRSGLNGKRAMGGQAVQHRKGRLELRTKEKPAPKKTTMKCAIYLLGDPAESKIPLPARTDILELDMDLGGVGIIEIDTSNTAQDIHRLIKNIFLRQDKSRRICHNPEDVKWTIGVPISTKEIKVFDNPSGERLIGKSKKKLFCWPNIILYKFEEAETTTSISCGPIPSEQTATGTIPMNENVPVAEGPAEEIETDLTKVTDMKAYRRYLYSNKQRNWITVRREPNRGLSHKEAVNGFSPLDEKEFDYKPVVCFEKEKGVDAGALLKEFVFQCYFSFVTQPWRRGAESGGESIPLFEGRCNLWLPSGNVAAVSSGMFHSIGKFMLFSGQHADFCFIGLHPLVQKYIFSDCVKKLSLMEWDINPEDIPDLSVQSAVYDLDSLARGELVDDLEELQDICDEFRVGVVVSNLMTDKEEATHASRLLKYNFIFGCRLRALEAMRTTFRSHPFFSWLQPKTGIVLQLFPRDDELEITVDGVINCFENTDEYPQWTTYLRRFLEEAKTRGEDLSKVLIFFTGYPFYHSYNLRFSSVDDWEASEIDGIQYNSIYINVCGERLNIAASIDEKTFVEAMFVSVYDVPLAFDAV